MMPCDDVDLLHNMKLNGTDPLWVFVICLVFISPLRQYTSAGMFAKRFEWFAEISHTVWLMGFLMGLFVCSVDSRVPVHQDSQSSQFIVQKKAAHNSSAALCNIKHSQSLSSAGFSLFLIRSQWWSHSLMF